MTKPLQFPIIEIYGPTIQGEGPEIGSICSFVRFGYCNDHCVWCDSLYAVDPIDVSVSLEYLTPTGIAQRISTGSRHVVLSGGNPVLHDLSGLVEILDRRQFEISVETQGNLFRPWLQDVDQVVISPKPPSAKTNYDLVELAKFMQEITTSDFPIRPSLTFKIPIFDVPDDLDFAEEVISLFPKTPMYFSVGNDVGVDSTSDLLTKFKLLVDEVYTRSKLADVYILPQLHVLVWGNERRR